MAENQTLTPFLKACEQGFIKEDNIQKNRRFLDHSKFKKVHGKNHKEALAEVIEDAKDLGFEVFTN